MTYYFPPSQVVGFKSLVNAYHFCDIDSSRHANQSYLQGVPSSQEASSLRPRLSRSLISGFSLLLRSDRRLRQLYR